MRLHPVNGNPECREVDNIVVRRDASRGLLHDRSLSVHFDNCAVRHFHGPSAGQNKDVTKKGMNPFFHNEFRLGCWHDVTTLRFCTTHRRTSHSAQIFGHVRLESTICDNVSTEKHDFRVDMLNLHRGP